MLAAVRAGKIGGLAGVLALAVPDPRRSPVPRVVAAAGFLDFPDGGAEIREALRGPGTGEDAAEVEDLDTVQRAHASALWAETYQEHEYRASPDLRHPGRCIRPCACQRRDGRGPRRGRRHRRAHRARGRAASEGTVFHEQLENRPLLRTGEILELVPGLVVTQHTGDGKANQYFLRGFNLDHGTDFLTQVEGMPVNIPTHGHGQGYMDLNFVIPELIEREIGRA